MTRLTAVTCPDKEAAIQFARELKEFQMFADAKGRITVVFRKEAIQPEEPVLLNDPEILREMKEIAIKTMANQVFLVERNIYRRYITGYRAVYLCEGGSLAKEVFKTEQEARRACVINGRVPKRVEVVYSLYMVRGELKNGETYEKAFKHEKAAKKFAEKASNNGTLDGARVIKMA